MSTGGPVIGDAVVGERVFVDRDDAGRVLAARVARYLGGVALPCRPLVVALPRGGVPVAVKVAATIGADVEVVVVAKIGAPGRPEVGVGALAEDAPPIFDRASLAGLGIVESDLVETVAAERSEVRRRIARYRGDRPVRDVSGRVVIVVDDGLATGITACASLRWLKARMPARLVMASPVCSRQARTLLADQADAVVCLHSPESFTAVSCWYTDFRQLGDGDIDRCLAVTPSATWTSTTTPRTLPPWSRRPGGRPC